MPRHDDDLPRTLAYLQELETRGRYTLMVWPIHCEIGSWGHNVHADVRAAYNRWEDAGQHIVRKVPKGTNPWTEHYSALMAEVPDPDDPRTQLNRGLLDALDRAELLLIAGEAGSHCVKATVEDLAQHLPGGKLSRVVLLTDCMSPVPGFNAGQTAFAAHARTGHADPRQHGRAAIAALGGPPSGPAAPMNTAASMRIAAGIRKNGTVAARRASVLHGT